MGRSSRRRIVGAVIDDDDLVEQATAAPGKVGSDGLDHAGDRGLLVARRDDGTDGVRSLRLDDEVEREITIDEGRDPREVGPSGSRGRWWSRHPYFLVVRGHEERNVDAPARNAQR